MNNARKVCVVTGSRAEYGLLYWIMKEIAADPELELQVIATGMHLSPEFGQTYQQIEEDGFTIDAKVEMLLSSDTPVGIAKSLGLGVIGFADAFDRLKPDIIVVLGDRFEILAAAQAAMVIPVPMAHISGGDNGEATHDNITRHCLTKMAHLHFVTHERARQRVIQLGENPECVFDVGSLALDSLINAKLKSREELEKELGVILPSRYVVVTYHPTNLDPTPSRKEFREVLEALKKIQEDGYAVVFTMPNADNHGRHLRAMIDDFVKGAEQAYAFESFGTIRYLSVIKYASLVMGNSSSGIYESPLLRVPTVDIGNRQKGRPRGASVLHVSGNANEILCAARQALGSQFNYDDYPYGHEPAAPKIAKEIKLHSLCDLTYKRFFDLDVSNASK